MSLFWGLLRIHKERVKDLIKKRQESRVLGWNGEVEEEDENGNENGRWEEDENGNENGRWEEDVGRIFGGHEWKILTSYLISYYDLWDSMIDAFQKAFNFCWVPKYVAILWPTRMAWVASF